MLNAKGAHSITRKFVREFELDNFIVLILAAQNTWNVTRIVTRDESTVWKL